MNSDSTQRIVLSHVAGAGMRRDLTINDGSHMLRLDAAASRAAIRLELRLTEWPVSIGDLAPVLAIARGAQMPAIQCAASRLSKDEDGR